MKWGLLELAAVVAGLVLYFGCAWACWLLIEWVV